MGRIETHTSEGDVLEVTSGDANRREFLRALAVAGTGATGLQAATEAAFGRSPNGIPVVWTRDQYGRPDRIRYLPKERHRRLRVFEDCRVDELRGHSNVNGLTLTSRSDDPTDLALKVFVDRDSWRVRRKLPNRMRGVPVTHDERRLDPRPGRVCDEFSLNFFDPLRGNVEVNARGPRGYAGSGTLGFVCWNADAGTPSQCLITAWHVVAHDDGTPAEYLTHGGQIADGEGRAVTVGTYATHSSLGDRGMDVAKYWLKTDEVTGDPLATQSDEQPDITGTWDFAGLTDATTGDDAVPVTFAGQSTCYATARCTRTSKTELVEQQAVVTPNVVTDGDSGGPFVDPDGKLVGTFSLYCDSCQQCSGPVGTELLDRVGAQLSKPRADAPRDYGGE